MEEYEDDEREPCSPDPKDTEIEWHRVLRLCERKLHVGFGVLDSFLSGADLDKRISLVEREALQNEWLRLELKDTLSLDQTKSLSASQLYRLRKIIA